MKELLKVIEVWKKAEEAINLSSEKGSYTDGFHKGYIHGMEAVKELLSSQPGVEADGIIHCALCGFEIEPSNVICRDCLGGP